MDALLTVICHGKIGNSYCIGGNNEKSNIDFNEARQKMAIIPKGASLIENPVSVAPGFKINNVFVFAGVSSSEDFFDLTGTESLSFFKVFLAVLFF